MRELARLGSTWSHSKTSALSTARAFLSEQQREWTAYCGQSNYTRQETECTGTCP